MVWFIVEICFIGVTGKLVVLLGFRVSGITGRRC